MMDRKRHKFEDEEGWLDHKLMIIAQSTWSNIKIKTGFEKSISMQWLGI